MFRYIISLFTLFILLGTGNSQNWKNLDKTIQQAMEEFQTTGLSIAVVQNGEIVFQKAYGYRNASNKDPLKPDHLFNIASCSKAFTAFCMAHLIENSKLEWSDKVVKYLPEFKLQDAYISEHMTLEDLFCHRSGLATFYGDLLWYGTSYTDREVLNRMQYIPLTGQFGRQYGYQNNMYMVAALIIEEVSGMDWEEYVKTFVFSSVGMNDSYTSNDKIPNFSADNPKIALPHLKGNSIPLMDFEATKAAASIYSNTGDMTKWIKFMLNEAKVAEEPVIDQGQYDHLFQSQIPLPLSSSDKKAGIRFKNYAMGWKNFDYNNLLIHEHDGGMPGYISKVSLIPEKDMGIVILNNGMDFFINSALRFIILDEIAGVKNNWVQDYSEKKSSYEKYLVKRRESRLGDRKEGTSPSVELDSFLGNYVDKMYGDAKVSKKDGKLYLELLPTKMFQGEMEHWHYNTFKVKFKDPFLPFALITFQLDSKGYPKDFTIDLPNGDLHFFNLHFIKD